MAGNSDIAFFLRTTTFGELARLLSGNKIFPYPDEIDSSLLKKSIRRGDSEQSKGSVTKSEKGEGQELTTHNGNDEEILLVHWYGPDDPENPQNWPVMWKHAMMFQLCVLNFGVYIASSIYVPGEPDLMAEFDVSVIVATLGLSLFTLGYGVGPMLWSPLSEMPKIGRSRIFFWTLFAFVVFQLPVGFAPNIAVFLVFRWVTGFCGSPCLSTGAGTITDLYDPALVSYLICIWGTAGTCGPVFGPIIGGYLAPVKGWRWTIWVVTFLCAAVLVSMFFFFPETSEPNILYNRAKRFRKASGDNRYRSDSELHIPTAKDHLLNLARAFTLTFLEPIVLLMDMYAGLLYGVLFIWFESFPIVFGGIYGFNPGEQGLVFLSILIFALITLALFLLWIRTNIAKEFDKPGFKPEMVLPPTFVGCLAFPICLFFFGWTARASIHWIVPVIASGLFSIGVITLFNSLFNYLGISYPKYAASIFAGSALFRASFGATFPLFARQLFETLGVGPGNSLLGGIAVLFIPIPFIFYKYGSKIRHMSKNARHDV
ncbi:MFS general substrate transporter [Xylaria cf. heliscus]|nr:MFS general substrate transporter [Xylaria cf. heliscus]